MKMNRLFGRGKDKQPAPNLTDCVNNVCSLCNGIKHIKYFDCLMRNLRKREHTFCSFESGHWLTAPLLVLGCICQI